jgi:exonuclease III
MLSILFRWFGELKSDHVCLRELRAAQEKFLRAKWEKIAYGASGMVGTLAMQLYDATSVFRFL